MLKQDTITVQLNSILESFKDFYPEVSLTALFISVIILDLVFKKTSYRILPYFIFAGLLVTFYFISKQNLLFNHPQSKFLFFRFLHINQYEVFFKLLFNVASFLFLWFLLFSSYYHKNKEKIGGEFYGLFIALLLGLHLMVMAANMLMVYISIELVSICSYILTTFSFDKKSSEAGVKYILFGAFSSGIMVYGMSLLYGFTGSLQFYEPLFLNNLELSHQWLVLTACVLTLAGFLFKVAAMPFHLWTPDVYEAAPTPIVAFFSIAPKAAGMAVIINFTYPFFYNIPGIPPIDWKMVLGGIAIVTMTFGNLAALGQKNAKRLLAYSSIAHAGFILVAVLAFSRMGIWSAMFYFSVYLFMNFAAFALVDILASKTNSEDVSNFKGLGVKLPFAGVIFVVIMVALIGLPPTAGFNAKFLAFSALWEAYQESGDNILFWVFIVGLLNTVIALFYYLKIPYYMYFRKAESGGEIKLNVSEKVFLWLVTLPLLAFFFKPDWIMNYIQKIILNF